MRILRSKMAAISWPTRDVSYLMAHSESKEKVTKRFMYLHLNPNLMKQARYVTTAKHLKYFKSVSLAESLMVNTVTRNANYFSITHPYCTFNQLVHVRFDD